ncbi:hypothetical protein ACIVBQ_000175 [Tenacibaculum discolor]
MFYFKTTSLIPLLLMYKTSNETLNFPVLELIFLYLGYGK